MEPKTCPNCTYEPSKDLGKYSAVYVRGRQHVMLVACGTSLLVCQKCGSTFPSRNFKRKVPFWVAQKQLRRKSQQRVAQLRRLYH